ncbi:MAG: replicative DNA helicase [Nitrospinota bacterium]
MDISFQKLPPQNLESEQSVIGAILIENESLPKSLEIINEEDFYRGTHKKIFSAMKELFEKNEPIDLMTLTDKLRKRNELEDIGGIDYLSSLEETIPTATNVVYHCKIVKEKAILRSLISVSNEIIGQSYEDNEDVDSILDNAEKSIFEISEKKIRPAFISIDKILKRSFEYIERLYDRKEMVTGVPTGILELDNLTTGLQPSDLIIIAGRPSMGKTALALNIARNAAVESHIPVAIFSLEMSSEQIGIRMLCAEAKKNSRKLRTGYLSKTDWPDLTTAAGRLAESPIFIDDTAALSSLDIRARARRLQAEHKIGLVIVDYLQLMKGRSRAESRQLEISEITQSLKALAKELNLPVIALSQLSRAVEQRTHKKPQLSDLRESGAIEQDSDLVLFLYREEAYEENTENKGIAEVIIGKQRNGPIGTIKLTFLKEYAKFENLSPLNEETFT